MVAPETGSGLIFADLPRIFVPTLALVGALLLGALIIALVRRWQRNEKLTPDPGEELSRYHALYEQGAISEQEYRRLRTILGSELRRSMNLPATAPHLPEKLAEPSTEVQTAPDSAPGRDVPNLPTDGMRPAE
jgi:hypothetical protein